MPFGRQDDANRVSLQVNTTDKSLGRFEEHLKRSHEGLNPQPHEVITEKKSMSIMNRDDLMLSRKILHCLSQDPLLAAPA